MAYSDAQVVIVGAGIGGGAMAAVLARDGISVLVLEKTTVHRDRVRGEWIAPWGVPEVKELGLYERFMAEGGHHLSRHVSYDDGVDPAVAEANPIDLTNLVPESPGPLCLGHPRMCDVLDDEAEKAGATILRGVDRLEVVPGLPPNVRFRHEGREFELKPKLVIGADGRGSSVRRQAGIALQKDPTHHLFTGMLVEDVDGWPSDLQCTGTEGEVNYLVFPQSSTRVRLYFGFPRHQTKRLAGADSQQKFLDAFKLRSCPRAAVFRKATPAGPCHAYPNEDTWTDRPFTDGIVLVGDAAGHNDPIIGQGLSITFRDVRLVRDILREHKEWTPGIFEAYGEERAERMRRLRFIGRLISARDSEFGPQADARRQRWRERAMQDPTIIMPALTPLVGPFSLPHNAFEQATWDKLLGE